MISDDVLTESVMIALGELFGLMENAPLPLVQFMTRGDGLLGQAQYLWICYVGRM